MKNQPKHEKTGVYSSKDYENAKLLTIGLTLGLVGCFLALVLELIK